MTPEEYAQIFAENIARANIETFCKSHGLPIEAIEKTEKGYRFCIEFNYKLKTMEKTIKKIAEDLIEVWKLEQELKDKEYWIEKASKETDFIPAEGDWIHVEVTLFKIEVGVYHKNFGGAKYWRNGHWSDNTFDSNYPMYDKMLKEMKL